MHTAFEDGISFFSGRGSATCRSGLLLEKRTEKGYVRASRYLGPRAVGGGKEFFRMSPLLLLISDGTADYMQPIWILDAHCVVL